MKKNVDCSIAKEVMGENLIGIDEIRKIDEPLFLISDSIHIIPFEIDQLVKKKDDYFLIPAFDTFADGTIVNIKNMINIFGKNPSMKEPCFYNQDWYDKEEFIEKPIESGWFFIRKDVYEDSRAVQPSDLLNRYSFPSAIKCVYAFFVVWKVKGIKLWYHDFVWCNDTDHNGERVYVGKYHDADGVNKNGFSIHRHLALRTCYGCVD